MRRKTTTLLICAFPAVVAVLIIVAIRMDAREANAEEISEQSAAHGPVQPRGRTESRDASDRKVNPNDLQRLKNLQHVLSREAERNKLVDLGDGDFATQADIEFDKIANARGKQMDEGFAALESLLDDERNRAAENRVQEELKTLLPSENALVSPGEVTCVERFCKLYLESETLDATTAFLDTVKFNDRLRISSDQFSADIQLTEDPEDPDNAGGTPTVTNVFFSLDMGELPVNPTDFSSIDS